MLFADPTILQFSTDLPTAVATVTAAGGIVGGIVTWIWKQYQKECLRRDADRDRLIKERDQIISEVKSFGQMAFDRFEKNSNSLTQFSEVLRFAKIIPDPRAQAAQNS